MAFMHGTWIWCSENPQPDEYGEFVTTFLASQKKAKIKISCDSDYALWVNGTFVTSNQYRDYEHYKIYDTIDISSYLMEGINRIGILVWYFGTNSQRYIVAPAGLIFEVFDDDTVLVKSDTSILSRRSKAYQSHRQKIITRQLGFSFTYDASLEDDWKNQNCEGFKNSFEAKKECTFYPRPIEKQCLGKMKKGVLVRQEGNRYLFSLENEVVGLFSILLKSETEQNLVISYGEHLTDDGWVPRRIDIRDFSVEYRTQKGINHYFNPMLRIACLYLEVQSEHPIQIEELGIIPQYFPSKARPVTLTTPLDQKIYDMCVNTLNLCMMENYVDCPWREQNLYAFDSRNQMLCGYHVYENGNFSYARANLKLISKDRRSDGILSICAPCGEDLTIPSFSLYYFLAIKEYTEASGDITLAKEVYEKLKVIMDAILYHKKDGLIFRLEGKEYWNFYDWSQYSDGNLRNSEESKADAAISCLTILALKSFEQICSMAGIPFPYPGIADELKKNVYKTFFVPEKGLVTMLAGEEKYTDIVETLAVLAEVVVEEEARQVCEKMIVGETIPCSLSMRTLKYDALLKIDRDRYYPMILEEIRYDYGVMVEAGTDCVWETIHGHTDFGNAGSLCHGWSAVPVLYLPIKESEGEK